MTMALRVWRVLVAVWTTASEKHLGLIAAGVAFFGMFGIFPGIAAVIAIFGLVADPVVIAEQLALMEGIIPEGAYGLLSSQVNGLVNAPAEALGWATFVSITLALWSCRAGVAALIGGLNAIAGHRQRNGFIQLFVAFLLTMALVSMAIIAVLMVVVLPIAVTLISSLTATDWLQQGQIAWLLEGARWLIALGVLILALNLLYRYGPARIGGRGRWFTVGAFVVVILWVAASMGLSYYLSNFASYNEVYGSIGAVIGLLLWLYVSAYLILLGAALNVEVHGQTKPDRGADTAYLTEG